MVGGLAVLAGAVALSSPAAATATPPDRAAAIESFLVLGERAQTPAGWTGNAESCLVGAESQESLDATLNAVNTLRDFAGVGPVSFDPALNRQALAAALMMRAAGRLSHGPGPSWPCYSPEGAAGAGGSNLYLGLSGPPAMVGYVHDEGVASLGHRRWLLNPAATTFGTGSTGTSNALFVVVPEVPQPALPEVIAWPPPGNVPWRLIAGSWSAAINVPGAVDLSAATVQVSVGGRPLPVSGVADMGTGYGAGPMLKWDVEPSAGDRAADAPIQVTIGGVRVDGVPRLFGYAVQAMVVEPPSPPRAAGSRTATAITVSWDAAAERGAAVTGYQLTAFDGGGGPSIDRTVGPEVRSLTLPYQAPRSALLVQVVALSRAGASGPAGTIDLPAPPPPVIGSVTLRVVGSGRLRPGRRLGVKAKVSGHRLLRYRWLRNGRSITGATHSTYRVRRTDRGKRIRCRLTAVGDGGLTTTRLSSTRTVPRR